MRETSCCLFSDHNQVDVVEAFNYASRYLEVLLNNNPYFEQMVSQIYLTAKETHIFNIHLIPETLIKYYPK